MNDKDFEEFLDDRIDDWHNGNTVIPQLHAYLRMDWEEYTTWTTTGKLPFAMRSRWGFTEF